jgi:hypothetical protein
VNPLSRFISAAFAYAALFVGYWRQRSDDAIARYLDQWLPRRNWRMVALDELIISVPKGWGELEMMDDGGFVIHNRPQRYRIDGDAVWYSSAVELHIRSEGKPFLPASITMIEHRRKLLGQARSYEICLRLAKGVGRSTERLAKRVLSSARIVKTSLIQSQGSRRIA